MSIFRDIVSHPLFPIALKDNLEVVNFISLTAPSFESSTYNYAFLTFDSNANNFGLEHWSIPGNMGRDELTLGKFLIDIDIAISSIENWINKESAIKFNLNF